MKTLLRLSVLVAVIACASPALANDYITNDPDDRLTYTSDVTGQDVTARIQQVYGNWRLWSQFGGLGPTWVYTADGYDYFWVWNGTTYQLIANLSGREGEARDADLNSCNSGRITVAGRNLQVTTPAGTFNDVTEIRFSGSPCADAGVGSIYFARGVGVIGWTETTIMGPVTHSLRIANIGGRTIGGTTTNPGGGGGTTTPVSDDPVAASEHADMETILWGANDTYIVTEVYKDSFRGLDRSGVRSQVIVGSNSTASQLRYDMSQAGVPMGNVEILTARIDTVWMRDYGPIVLKRGRSGDRVVADPEYYWNRNNDNAIPDAYAGYRGWQSVDVRISYEGGNFATDGQGTAFSSLGVQWFNRDMSRSAIEREFAKMGCDEVVYVEPLIDEGTTHIDMFARVMSDDVAMVSRYPSSHRQARVCDAAAAAFRAKGYRVVRVDADYRYDEYATYTNSTLANGVALVPQYSDSAKNRAALQAYRDLGFTAVGVDSRRIIRYSGAVHCVSMQIPR